MRGRNGLRVLADHTFETAPQPDVLVVPGGPVTRERPETLESAVAYVRRTAAACRLTLSVCTGAFILARAGLLEGRSCTTHYLRRHLLAAQFPGVNLQYARVVSDGKIISTAGVAAGIDGSLFAVSQLFGMEQARKVANAIEHPWDPTQVSYAGAPHQHDEHEEARAAWA